MPIVLGGGSARFMRRKGDICASFQYVNDEPAMCLFPAVKKGNAGAFVVCESAAHLYADDGYLVEQAHRAAEVMGLDTTGATVFRIADCISLWLDDLLMLMPPKPEDAVIWGKARGPAGELEIDLGGERFSVEVPA